MTRHGLNRCPSGRRGRQYHSFVGSFRQGRMGSFLAGEAGQLVKVRVEFQELVSGLA
jgi:hypothetical protein